MSIIVKICGLTTSVAMDAALDAGADMVGFVFFERSPRHLDLSVARTLGARVEGRARKVALTVDADDAALEDIVAALEPDLLQMHGSETPQRVAQIGARFGLPVIRAIAIADRADLAQIADVETTSDHLLFDARPPAGADRLGGNGVAFDWSLLRDVPTRKPWLLAGGLTPTNVAEALATTGALGIDVSSGVETAPGRKDPALIADFIARARSATAPARDLSRSAAR